MSSIVQRNSWQDFPARASAKGPDEGRVPPWLRAGDDMLTSRSTDDMLASRSTDDMLASRSTDDMLASRSTSFSLPGYGAAGPVFWTDETLPEPHRTRLGQIGRRGWAALRGGDAASRAFAGGMVGAMLFGGLALAGARIEAGGARHHQSALIHTASVRLSSEEVHPGQATGLGLHRSRLVETVFHLPSIVQTPTAPRAVDRAPAQSAQPARPPAGVGHAQAAPVQPILLSTQPRCVQALVAVPMTPPQGAAKEGTQPNPADLPPVTQANGVAARAQVKTLAGRYSGDVRRAAVRYHVPVLVAAAVLHVESRATAHTAISKAGAIGPMQLMPHTAWAVLRINPWEPAKNIDGGVKYLGLMIDRFHSVKLALVAYNAGPTAVATATAPDSAWQYAANVLKLAAPPEQKFPY